MINLLPTELKQDYRYARYNQTLITWSAFFVITIIGVIILTAFGLFIMNNSMKSYKTSIKNNQLQLASENMPGIEMQVSDISNNLKLMVNVLSQEIMFSKLLQQLGNITPPKVILTNLSISQSQSAVEITAQTGDYSSATQLQINLADPANKIFSKADIVNISCLSGTQITNPNYPCTADIRAQFTKNNPFLFINSTVSQATP